MAERYDAIVLGAGLTGSLVAATASQLGARVLLVDPGPAPGATGLSGGIVRPTGQGKDPSLGAGAVERPLVEHRMMVLDDAAAVSFDFRDVPKDADLVQAVSVRSAVLAPQWAESATARGARLVVGASDLRATTEGSGRATGIRIGGESYDAPAIVLAEHPLATPAFGGPPASETMRIEETFALSERSLENRFQLRAGQGSSVECLLGFLPSPWTGMGWLVPHRSHLTVGMTLHRPVGSEAALGLEAAFERFRSHPAIAGYTTGGVRVDRRSYPVDAAPSRRGLASSGFLRVGPSAGLGDPVGVLAAGLAPALASARAAGEAIAAKGPLERGYLARLAEAGVLTQIEQARRNPLPTGWDGARRRRYAQVLSRTFHQLLTETGAPKEPITRTLRRVRKESGMGVGSLAWDGFTLGRNL